MELDHSPKGFEIKDSLIPILLALRPISSLRPHEETVPLELDRIISSLRHDSLLRHPIIVDQETGLVLDGTHRLAALKAQGFQSAPCALINYQDPRVRVERWFRVIQGTSLSEFKGRLAGRPCHDETPGGAEECLSKRTCYASLEDDKYYLVFPSPSQEPLEIAKNAFEIERVARENGLKVKYSDDKDRLSSNKTLVLSTVKLEKREVVQSAMKGVLFPPKTTRHIIPSRPLGLSTPLEWLKTEPLTGVQEKFTEHLKSRQVKRLPEGSKVGSRRYQEEVFLFD